MLHLIFPVNALSPKSRHASSAFSLVEVVIALGILAFSGVTMMGLLPVAFNSLQSSTFDTIATRIAASARSDLQQTELDGSGKGIRYYDGEGRAHDSLGARLSAGDKSVIYEAYLSESDYQMPGTTTINSGLRRITVQVLHNPAHKSLPQEGDGWVDVPGTIPTKTFCFYVVR